MPASLLITRLFPGSKTVNAKALSTRLNRNGRVETQNTAFRIGIRLLDQEGSQLVGQHCCPDGVQFIVVHAKHCPIFDDEILAEILGTKLVLIFSVIIESWLQRTCHTTKVGSRTDSCKRCETRAGLLGRAKEARRPQVCLRPSVSGYWMRQGAMVFPRFCGPLVLFRSARHRELLRLRVPYFRAR
jgi:hypothetical protein